jgi:hypothetical protein
MDMKSQQNLDFAIVSKAVNEYRWFMANQVIAHCYLKQ